MSRHRGNGPETEKGNPRCAIQERRTGLSHEVLDVHTLNNAPVAAAMKIIKVGKLLFCRDPLLHAEYVENISNSRRRLAGILDIVHA